MGLSAVYSNTNASLSIRSNGLGVYQIKAPVHWGVNATKPLCCQTYRFD